MRTKIWLFAAMFVVGCATGGDVDSQTSDELGNACQPRCEKCHPGDVCTALCTYPTHCPRECTEFQMCIVGYTWNEGACACEPTQPAGESCGPDLTCHGQDHCCTGPGPVSSDPSQNTYYCASVKQACPL